MENVCSEHGMCHEKFKGEQEKLSIRIVQLEETVEKWPSKFKGYKDFFNKEIDSLKSDIKMMAAGFTETQTSLVKIEMLMTHMSERIEELRSLYVKQEEEKKENKKSIKDGIVFPLAVALIIGLLTYIASK
jgi:predicted  nucleic acid-binding Zn-ribbon protein